MALQSFQLGIGLRSWLPVYFWNWDSSSITQTGEYFDLAFTNRATTRTPPAPFIFSEDVLAPQNIARQRETSSLEMCWQGFNKDGTVWPVCSGSMEISVRYGSWKLNTFHFWKGSLFCPFWQEKYHVLLKNIEFLLLLGGEEGSHQSCSKQVSLYCWLACHIKSLGLQLCGHFFGQKGCC